MDADVPTAAEPDTDSAAAISTSKTQETAPSQDKPPVWSDGLGSGRLPPQIDGPPPPPPDGLADPLYWTQHAMGGATGGTRNRVTKSSKACERCRRTKSKCDEEVPCGRCRMLGLGSKCEYQHPRNSPMSDKRMEEVCESINKLQHNMDKLLQHLPIACPPPTRGRQPVRSSLEAHLGSQGGIAVSVVQRDLLRNVETSLDRLREFDNWRSVGPRLAWYISSLCQDNGFDSQPEPLGVEEAGGITVLMSPHEDPSKGQPALGSDSRDASRERQFFVGPTPPLGLKRKRSPSLQSGPEPEKPFFCFHQSCDRTYGSGKTLENHLRSQHTGRMPNLPGTCDFQHGSGSIKRFATWEECLEHFIFHQKSGMGRYEYDRVLEAAEFLFSFDNQQVESTRLWGNSPATSLVGGSPVSFPTGGTNFGWVSSSQDMNFGL